MTESLMKQKLVQYFNEALAMENAAVDRNQTRMSETPIPLVKQQLQYHLEQTFVQQERLRTIITNLGGTPTSAKAVLPKMMPMDMDTLANTVKETAKSLVSSKSKDRVDAEYELIQTKQDAIIENGEIVTYKMLMEISQKVGLLEVLPLLQQSLLEETAMENFIVSTAPLALTILWPELMKDSEGEKVRVVPDGKNIAVAADGTYVKVSSDQIHQENRYVKATQS
ncbi:MAG: ferritin-like domain-containing protein [Thermoproteota archaeon]|jgi:ferritin-like metal-binding protein YciE|nr:ferritin-like domain-containing protein [Thermoproteota archaeon]MDQ3806591.1 ferritin-like domain-containing protein [Thermoproteota archaeon]